MLLRLIERREMDITQVSLALVADQYLAHIALLRELSAANLADFLVIAARLLVIKSRHLLPAAAEEEDEEEEVGEGLAQQLREYRRYKQAAEALRGIETSGERSYPRLAPAPAVERAPHPGEMSVDELVSAFRRMMEIRPPPPPVDHVVPPLAVHMADCVALIERTMRRHRRVRFSTILRRSRSRLEAIVTFLAILELLKQQRLRATQEVLFGEIHLERCDPPPDADVQPLDLSEYGEGAG